MEKCQRKFRLEKECDKVIGFSHQACLTHILKKMMDEAIGDDQAIVPGSAGAFQEMINKMNCTVKKYNMIINVKKTKIMVIVKTKIRIEISI